MAALFFPFNGIHQFKNGYKEHCARAQLDSYFPPIGTLNLPAVLSSALGTVPTWTNEGSSVSRLFWCGLTVGELMWTAAEKSGDAPSERNPA